MYVQKILICIDSFCTITTPYFETFLNTFFQCHLASPTMINENLQGESMHTYYLHIYNICYEDDSINNSIMSLCVPFSSTCDQLGHLGPLGTTLSHLGPFNLSGLECCSLELTCSWMDVWIADYGLFIMDYGLFHLTCVVGIHDICV